MKHRDILIPILLLTSLLLSACGSEKTVSTVAAEPAAPIQSDISNPDISDSDISAPDAAALATSEPEFANNNPNEEAPHQSAEEIIAHYESLYAAQSVYTDVLMPQKVLLIGESDVVELMILDGYSKTTVIQRKNIERVECTSLDEFSTIKLFDKTNQSISINTEPETAEEILAGIDQSDASSEN